MRIFRIEQRVVFRVANSCLTENRIENRILNQVSHRAVIMWHDVRIYLNITTKYIYGINVATEGKGLPWNQNHCFDKQKMRFLGEKWPNFIRTQTFRNQKVVFLTEIRLLCSGNDIFERNWAHFLEKFLPITYWVFYFKISF